MNTQVIFPKEPAIVAQDNQDRKKSYPGEAPDPQVSEKPVRRRFSAQYKMEILRELDAAATQQGQVGAILRREGIYSSNIVNWRRQRKSGELQGLSPKRRGPASKPGDPDTGRIEELERENRRLNKKLEYANLLLDIQKKISEITKIPLKQVEFEEEDL